MRTAQQIVNEIESARKEQARMLEQVGDWNLFDNTENTPNTDAIYETYRRKIEKLETELAAAAKSEYIAKGKANIGT